MKMAQVYCTEAELIADLGLNGRAPRLFDRIQAASRFINRRFGHFIPVTETRNHLLNGMTLFTSPILSISEVKNNDAVVTDYDAYPLERYWANGPYTRLEANSFAWEDVDITGRWGKYEETADLGIAATQLITAATLSVADGSLLSPGAVLLIDDEQELVIDYGPATAATSLLAGAVTASDEAITVDNGAEFYTGEVIQLSNEDCYIRAIRGNVLICGRGWNGTAKEAHANDLPISVYRTYVVNRAVNGTIAAAHTSAAVSRYVVPDDINWLCREIAGLMHKKAQSGFSGKVGNAELGETFYFNEFPSQIKEVARNYRIVQL